MNTNNTPETSYISPEVSILGPKHERQPGNLRPDDRIHSALAFARPDEGRLRFVRATGASPEAFQRVTCGDSEKPIPRGASAYLGTDDVLQSGADHIIARFAKITAVLDDAIESAEAATIADDNGSFNDATANDDDILDELAPDDEVYLATNRVLATEESANSQVSPAAIRSWEVSHS